MITFKCKMCGGDLNPEENATTCECEYCGSVQTIPTADNEKKGNLFNRANRLRMAAEYDKAAAVYTSITAEFPEEAEAYWGLCLCKYGIEYVEDPVTAKKIPTCHRTRSESIMDDPDFDQACENADVVAKRVYREEAKAIDRLQQDILSVVANESPYDVFICYKETDDNGQRTEDSVLAQDIYDSLMAKDLKVFFARITLEDKLGQQYEPYIYAALHSAKVMLAIGTQFEYFDAVWVKNEWSRFLDMTKSDKTKTLIPCYKDIDAYDMPREFKNLQGQDMGKLGWLQDLTRGVMKLCSRDGTQPTNIPTAVIQTSSPTIDSLLRRATVFLEDSKWDDARTYADKVLDMEVENGQAYLVKLMADLEVTNEAALKELKTTFDGNDNYRKIVRFGDAELVGRVEDYLSVVRKTNETLNNRIAKIKREYEQQYSLYVRKKTEREEAEKAYKDSQKELTQINSDIYGLKRDLEYARGPFDRKIRANLERQIESKEMELTTIKERAIKTELAFANAKKQEVTQPDRAAYYYELGNAYFEVNRYEEAYKQYLLIRGYADVSEKIAALAKLISNVEIYPAPEKIIDSLSHLTKAKDMIREMNSMSLSQDSIVYKKIMDVLQRRELIERMYGVNHNDTMNALKSIKID